MKAIISTVILAAAVIAGPAGAQQYPSRPVRIIVPFPAGGTTDILARDLANNLKARWNSAVVVDNKAGASGTLGSHEVTRAEKDGYTLMLTATHHVINPSIRKTLPYDTTRDFTNLALIATVPNVLVVNRDFPAKTVADLIRMAQEKPGSISFASTGIGGANHLSGELFKVMAGINMVHIPYKGAAPAMNDLLGGHVPVMFDGLPGVTQAISSGRLRVLGVTTLRRLPALPDVPTIDESGVKGFEVLSWFGLYGPSSLPGDVVRRISTDVNTALASADIRERYAKHGADPGSMSQEQFSGFVAREIAKWSRVVEQAKVPRE
jgi:tripartite-type tricarboxylate transporter receptor subunit TctC